MELLQSRAITPVIPCKRNRRVKRSLDSETYKERHLIECFFNKVKNYRRLATRYEKTANMFTAFLVLLSIRLWIKIGLRTGPSFLVRLQTNFIMALLFVFTQIQLSLSMCSCC
ncbi:transposase [Paenibacillus sp. UY79]|nr:transposase [Paenibacillus farraposensis]